MIDGRFFLLLLFLLFLFPQPPFPTSAVEAKANEIEPGEFAKYVAETREWLQVRNQCVFERPFRWLRRYIDGHSRSLL